MKLLNTAESYQVSGGALFDEIAKFSQDIQKKWEKTTPEQIYATGIVGFLSILGGNPHTPIALRAAVMGPVWYISCLLKEKPFQLF